MVRQGHAVDNTLTQEEYERLLLFCASIADEKKSIETFFYHLMVGYGRMRPGTLCHYHPDWYDPERQVIQVPGYDECDCCDCKKYARQRADGENEDRSFEEILKLYWNGKENRTARAIPLKTERQVEIVEKFNETFGHLDKPVGSYSHVRRRLTRTVELVDGVIDPQTYKPYINRATAVTHFAWADMSDTGLTLNFGWASADTIDRYRARCGEKAAASMDDMYGRDRTSSFELNDDPPTWSQYRRQADESVEVDIWTPQTKSEIDELPPEKEEEALKNRTLQKFITGEDSNTTNSMFGIGTIVALANSLKTRVRYAILAMIYDSEGNDITTRAGKKRAISAIIGIGVGVLLMAALGNSIVEITVVLALSLLIAKCETDFDEPPTLPLPK